jgi:hypothetical protein
MACKGGMRNGKFWFGNCMLRDHLEGCGCKENIKMDLETLECQGIDWIELASDRAQYWAFVRGNLKHSTIMCSCT